MPEEMIFIIVIVAALLNIILFFKVWGMTNNTDKIRLFLEAQRPDLGGMTNNTDKIRLFLEAQRPDLEYKEEHNYKLAHYGERVQEKKD